MEVYLKLGRLDDAKKVAEGLGRKLAAASSVDMQNPQLFKMMRRYHRALLDRENAKMAALDSQPRSASWGAP